MRPTVTFLAALSLCAITGAVQAAPASAPHAAACVAALKAQETGLTASLKSGAPVESDLLNVMRSGIAIIGRQYLSGLGETEARALLDAADKAFPTLPPGEATLRQRDCLREGHAFYEQASPIERHFITSAAQHRIKRLLAA